MYPNLNSCIYVNCNDMLFYIPGGHLGHKDASKFYERFSSVTASDIFA